MIRHHFRDLPIGRKLTLIALPICAAGLLLAFVAVTWLSAATLRRGTEQQTRSLAAVVAENSAGALSFSDAENAGRTLRGLAATPGIVLACLYQSGEPGTEPGLLATYGLQAASRCPPRPLEQPGRNRLQVLQPVRAGGDLIGHLLLERDLSDLRRQTEVTIATSFASFVLALLLIAALLALVQPRIVAPILDLAAKAAAIRLTRNYNLRARRQGQDEVGSLVDSFNAMLDEIQQTQSQLVQSEKMAALAGLVAGVAHEVNTPIGIGVTGISHLRQELQRVDAAWREGSLGRQQLERFLQLCAESTLLVMTHLERAADLVASFKKVAVDQTADDMREFELGGYLREVVLSLAPMFKNSGHELRLEPGEPIPLLSYPGAVAQIVTNLVMNAQIHGLDGISAGRVTVSVSRHGDEARLSVADNGRGVPLAHRDSLFQPFFTTRRHAGGTGLGLHLVYNLVTQRLRGRIVFESTEGQGTVFHVSFPCRASTP